MKKTLIALAVLAASGASFAQVTITGNLTMGYQARSVGVSSAAAATGGTSTESSGFGVDTSEIDFAATEDLGSGMKIIAKMALLGADRSGQSNTTTAGGVTGGDASMTLATPVGMFTLATMKLTDYLSGGIAGVNAYYAGFEGKVLGARTSRDGVIYTLPMKPFTLTLAYAEVANGLGLGGGTSGSNSTTQTATTNAAVGQTLQQIALNYAKGPAVVDVQFLNYLSSAGPTNPATPGATLGKTQVRLSGSYDLGVVKLGAGHVVSTLDNGTAANPKTYDTLVGASVPLGNLTLGGQFVSRRSDDLPTFYLAVLGSNGTQNGWNVQATYALSKRTSMIANYARWDGTVGNATQTNQTQLLLSHSF
jgi:predicted porin